jgi:mycothiol synthase
MPYYTSRSYSHPSDLPTVIDFLKKVRPVNWVSDYPGIVDMQEALSIPAAQDNLRLWFDGKGRLVAYIFVDLYNNLNFEVLPEVEPNLENEFIDWGFTCIRKTGEDATLDACCRAEDLKRLDFLDRHGFVRQEVSTLQMARRLDENLPVPKLPDGFRIRPIEGEHEAGAIVALHRAAFGTGNMTIEERLAIMRTPEYMPALDLVVIAPNGQLAAYCTCFISMEENTLINQKIGHTDPVATHPDFQGRGLARTMLLTGMHLLKRRGMDVAIIGTSSENIGMQKAAEAVGFCIISRKYWFSKTLA